jgi:PhnO protein
MNIRTGTLADVDALLDLMEELLEPPGSPPPGYSRDRARDGLRYLVESKDADVLVAHQDGRIVGLATLYRTFPAVRHGWRCWLQDLVVTGPARSSGVGKALLDAATDWARERGCTHLMLDSGHGRKDAHRFYLREGMAQESLTFKRQIT